MAELETEIRHAFARSLAAMPARPDLRARITNAVDERSSRPQAMRVVAASAALLLVGAVTFVVLLARHIPPAPIIGPTPSGQSPTPSVASPSPSPSQPVACRLPVDRGAGAFIDIPANPSDQGTRVLQSTSDPTSQVNLPNGEPRLALSYDWSLKRWLPVPSRWVAPDGTRYVYTDSQARVHLVGVSRGSDTILAAGANWGLYAFTADGIYAGQRDPSKQPALLGLWRISSSGGAPKQLTDQGTWLVVGTDAAWSVVQQGLPPNGSSVREDSVGSVLMRLDLKTGRTTTWYTSAGGRFRVATLDAVERPVLWGVDGPVIWIVTATGAAQTINPGGVILDVMADVNGIWYMDPMASSVYLIKGNVVERVGQYGYGGPSPVFAGPCR
jgi:hypothetical protein